MSVEQIKQIIGAKQAERRQHLDAQNEAAKVAKRLEREIQDLERQLIVALSGSPQQPSYQQAPIVPQQQQALPSQQPLPAAAPKRRQRKATPQQPQQPATLPPQNQIPY